MRAPPISMRVQIFSHFSNIDEIWSIFARVHTPKILWKDAHVAKNYREKRLARESLHARVSENLILDPLKKKCIFLQNSNEHNFGARL